MQFTKWTQGGSSIPQIAINRSMALKYMRWVLNKAEIEDYGNQINITGIIIIIIKKDHTS